MMTITTKYQQISHINAIRAAAKSHGKNVDSMGSAEAKLWMQSWAKKHRNIAEHIVLSIEISGISRELGSLISDHTDGITITEMSQRYRPVLNNKSSFAYDHPYNNIAIDAYDWFCKNGIKKEDARYILPLNVCTEMVVTANRETWIRICRSLKKSSLYGSAALLNEIMKMLSHSDGNYDYILIDKDPPYTQKRGMEVVSADITHDINTVASSILYDGSWPLISAKTTMSESAYYQFKRHRKITGLTRMSRSAFHVVPPSIVESSTALSVWDDTIRWIEKNSFALPINASMVIVNFICTPECWNNIKHFRMANDAQWEIRDVVKTIDNCLNTQ